MKFLATPEFLERVMQGKLQCTPLPSGAWCAPFDTLVIGYSEPDGFTISLDQGKTPLFRAAWNQPGGLRDKDTIHIEGIRGEMTVFLNDPA